VAAKFLHPQCLDTIELLLTQIAEICSDPRILHDYSLYKNALVDYDYTRYKAQRHSPEQAGRFYAHTGWIRHERKREKKTGLVKKPPGKGGGVV